MITDKKNGIQRKFLLYVMGIVGIALVMTGISIEVVINKNVRQSSIDKYTYVNDKLATSLSTYYEELDELTQNCIANNYVQESLLSKEMSNHEKEQLMKAISYMDDRYMTFYLYMDNKDNLFSQQYLKLDARAFKTSDLYRRLGDDYSKQKWMWARDTIFNTNEYALFSGRYIRQMDRIHEPGALFIKLDDRIFSDMVLGLKEEKAAYFFLDSNNQFCYTSLPQGYNLTKATKVDILDVLNSRLNENRLADGTNVDTTKEGIVCSYYHKDSGFWAVTFIPNQIINASSNQVRLIICVVLLLVGILAFLISSHFSKKFTKPIKQISNTMRGFDGSRLDDTIVISTNTELDTIGTSYNKMLANISQLVEEVKKQENELRQSELNSLIHQINPHFLYNTLDTIYMLARINKEKTTMDMIQSLSNLLRISLSKGKDVISIDQELKHVESYMEIQKIRNNNLFHYEIEASLEVRQLPIIKLILQPLVENIIKHGFYEIEEGGYILIKVTFEEEFLVFSIENNGLPMDKDKMKQINDFAANSWEGEFPVAKEEEGGYGLDNVIKRLRIKYGDHVSFYFEERDGYLVSILKIERGSVNEEES